ncbi:MAG: tRNA-guanine transglycosylase [Phycisphaeraceae bacterium]|nr:tRNA-guanine transglycosylase [Phycisphaeraceae bacterium]
MAFDDCPPSVDPSTGDVNQPRLMSAVERDSRAEPGREDGESGIGRPMRAKRKRGYDHADRLRIANERTVRWLERCKAAHDSWRAPSRGRGAGGSAEVGAARRALFGIVQGGTDLQARSWSAERICGVELPGYAIGGVAVGEGSDQIARVVAHTAPLLPEGKPRYLMGVGYERDLLLAVLAGVDMFDCVLPTRNGRNANAFTSRGQIRLRNAKYTEDPRPIEEGCDCPACWTPEVGIGQGETPDRNLSGLGRTDERPFSRAYIRHLFMAQEMLGPILVSLHNLRHFQRFMSDVRATVASDGWEGLVERWPVAASGLESARALGVLRKEPVRQDL